MADTFMRIYDIDITKAYALNGINLKFKLIR